MCAKPHNGAKEGENPFESPRVQHAAVLFVDIVDFTAIVEGMEPERIFMLLRSFYRRMCRVVFTHRGTIEKYLGDAILATFATSMANSTDATNALTCSHEMLREIERWNEKRAACGAATVSVGIGIHYGPVFTGNIGDECRPEFAVIGDVVNVASRIERLTRRYKSPLIVSGDLVDAARREGERAHELLTAFVDSELSHVPGRRNPIPIRIYKNQTSDISSIAIRLDPD